MYSQRKGVTMANSKHKNHFRNIPVSISREKSAEYAQLTDVQLIKRYRLEGDYAARNYLVVKYMDLYFKLAHQFSNSMSFDEAVQLCALCCMRVIDKFDYDREANSLSTLLHTSLPRALMGNIRANRRHTTNTYSINDTPKDFDDGSDGEYNDVISMDEDINIEHLYSADNMRALQYALSSLDKNKTEYKVLSLYYGLGNSKMYNQQDIAKKLNLSQSAVSRALTSCHKKLREILEGRGYSAENIL